MKTILDIPGSRPPNCFSLPIQAFLATTKPSVTTDKTAAHFVTLVTTSSDPAHALWELWAAFFTVVVTSNSHLPHLALLDALRAHPPTQPNNVRAGSDAQRRLRSYIGANGKLHWEALPRFSAQWREVHDILETWRDWDGVHDSDNEENSTVTTLSSSGAEYFIRFCNFSAALLKATNGKGAVHPIWVFYACRDVLERERPEFQSRQQKPHRNSPEQVWALDVRVTATWMRDGGRALWEADQEELRQNWASVLDDHTELWPREGGLTREQWQLWERRLRDLSTEEGILYRETKAVVTEAAKVISGLLEGN